MANKIGVDKETWDSDVAGQETAVSAIASLSEKELGKTTLNRFNSLIGLETTFNTNLTSYKTYTQGSTARMKQAGDTIVQEDASQAQQIQNNTHSVRFK